MEPEILSFVSIPFRISSERSNNFPVAKIVIGSDGMNRMHGSCADFLFYAFYAFMPLCL